MCVGDWSKYPGQNWVRASFVRHTVSDVEHAQLELRFSTFISSRFAVNSAPPLPPRSQSLTADRHRYFRIPFVRPSDQQQQLQLATSNLKGWWFAHFDGQWIARQMELHPNKAPILLMSGKTLANIRNFFSLTDDRPSKFSDFHSQGRMTCRCAS